MKSWFLPILLLLSGCVKEASVATQQIEHTPTATDRAVVERRHPAGLPPQPVCNNFEPEFLVTYNLPATETIRRMQVLLAPSDFDEQNLRRIFDCLSKANPEPEHLIIRLETDRSRVHIPDGTPGTGAGGLTADPREYDFLQAIYFRRPGNGDRVGKEYFQYSPQINVHHANFNTVIIRKSTGSTKSK